MENGRSRPLRATRSGVRRFASTSRSNLIEDFRVSARLTNRGSGVAAHEGGSFSELFTERAIFFAACEISSHYMRAWPGSRLFLDPIGQIFVHERLKLPALLFSELTKTCQDLGVNLCSGLLPRCSHRFRAHLALRFRSFLAWPSPAMPHVPESTVKQEMYQQ